MNDFYNLCEILDSSPGSISPVLVERWPGVQVLGVDPDVERIKLAEKTYGHLRPDVQFQVGDDKTFDFKESEFDLIILSHVITWIVDKERLIANFGR